MRIFIHMTMRTLSIILTAFMGLFLATFMTLVIIIAVHIPKKERPVKQKVEISYKLEIAERAPINYYFFETKAPYKAVEVRNSSAPLAGNLFNPIPPRTLSRGNINEKKVALTIDDGPNEDPRILKFLAEQGIRCTVFLTGNYTEKHPDWVLYMNRLGFEICIHTWDHEEPWTNLSNQEILESLYRTQAVISKSTHKVYPYVRPPWGEYNQRVLNLMAQNGFRIILWSNDLGGYEVGVKAEKQIEKAISNLKNGDIILGHFGSYNSYQVIKAVVEEALAQGYEFVTVSELINNL